MRRNVLNSPRLSELKKRRQRAFFAKILISGLGCLVVFFLLVYLSRLGNLNISKVQISGNKVLETESLQNAVEEELAGKFLWLFPKTNILYYPKGGIKTELQNKFRRISSVELSVDNKKTLLVSLTERTPKYIWCGENLPVPDDNNQKCYFMDENGYVFDEAPYFSGEVYFKFYGPPDAEHPIAPGSYFLKQNFKQLVIFKDILPNMGLKPVALDITKDNDIEIFLSRGNALAEEPKVILKTDTDFQNAAQNLEAALGTEPLMSQFKNKYSSLKYIDLRFGNKVYYKFK